MTAEQRHDHSPHDWQSPEYVRDWISNDVTKDEERRPLLRRMLEKAGFTPDAAIKVLDVGAGYGMVTSVVLEAFPCAQVTLQDYSAPMLEHARKRLSSHANATRFAHSNLQDPAWAGGVDGPYDLAVSAIAIHTIGGRQYMEQVYQSLYGLLQPGGVLLNCDYDYTAPAEMHAGWLRQAGFEQVEVEPAGLDHLFVFSARKPS